MTGAGYVPSAGDLPIVLCGQTLTLLPERAVYWNAEATLLVADPHWGKAATFRASGVPVPSGTTREATSRLQRLIDRTGATRIIFLGDLLHAFEGRSSAMLASLSEWRAHNTHVDVVLVRGNHDRGAGDPPADLRMTCVDAPYQITPFVLSHHPRPSDRGYVLAGHVHPAVRLSGAGRQSERLPCFVVGAEMAILPAFGDFTGFAENEPGDDDLAFAIADGCVIEVGTRHGKRIVSEIPGT